MSENAAEVVVGGVVLAAAVAFVLFAAQATGYAKSQGDTYPLIASFRSVQGISVGTDVRLAGIKVGTITSLKLDPKTYFADATIAVKKGLELPTDSAILISQESLLGGDYVEIVPGGAPGNLKPGDRILDTQGSVSLISLLMKFVGGQGGGSKSSSGAAATSGTGSP
ncbi:outer membrane lipid asymmetry maintenance protein MlaD [Solirhodobacter olei]|uniref:outer membrane lipid asymmetry maintenance protein MlaD n=1 Tax=Solirhodobacter olei TaxID=2493082 RepID=UPI000FDBF926|nr:outer membrane lipid asymmetry maintenance protein MlaD [Solirhodobacter olei]